MLQFIDNEVVNGQVVIYKNGNGDSRTAPKDVKMCQFQKANAMHIGDVRAVMGILSEDIRVKGEWHDYTKDNYCELFYSDFISTLNGRFNFTDGEWYAKHIAEERHHLLSNCPDDVNLLDLLEMVVDCVCAGKARSGEIRGLEITPEILQKALANTVKLVDDMTVVSDSRFK